MNYERTKDKETWCNQLANFNRKKLADRVVRALWMIVGSGMALLCLDILGVKDQWIASRVALLGCVVGGILCPW